MATARINRATMEATERPSLRLSKDRPVTYLTWCPVHTSEPENMFCEDHRKIVCTACRRVNHASCRSVVPIAEASTRLSGTISVAESQSRIKQFLDACGTVARERQWDLNELDNKKSETRQAILQVKQKFVAKIDKLIDEATADLERTVTLEKAEVAGHVVTLSDIARKLEADLTSIRKANHENKELAVFIAVQKAAENHKLLIQQFAQVHKEAHKVSMLFDDDEHFKTVMKGVTTVGCVSTKRSPYKVVPDELLAMDRTFNDKFIVKEHEIRKPPHGRKAAFVRDIYIRAPTDADKCWVTGMAVLCDGSLIIADHSNSCLKIISANGTVATTHAIKSPPFDVAILGQTEFFVSIPELKEILRMRIYGLTNIEKVSGIETAFECYGLVVHGEDFFVTSTSEKSVFRMTMKGDIKWKINLDQNGQPLFEWPWYIAINTDAERLFITDRRTDTLTKMDIDGNVKYKRTLNAKGPRGLTLDHAGNCVVCFFLSDELEISSVDTLYEQMILLTKREGIKQPQTVVYDGSKGQLILASESADSLLVYDIT